MPNDFQGLLGHSADHFGETRDHWWNTDFLRLMAARWRLDAVGDVLDVGCGVGHWGMTLETVLPKTVRVTGIDRETAWIEHATLRATAKGLAHRFSYRLGQAERLPFADESFDLTTCQTVLIHVPDPSVVISEMKRVTKPGGLIAVAEPNNLAGTLLMDSIAAQASIDELLELVQFQLLCERGKTGLGEGDSSLGERVAGLFAAAGLVEIDAFVNDKTTAVYPPYASVEQRAFVAEVRDRVARGMWNEDEARTRRHFLAGGGAEIAFADLFVRRLAADRRLANALEEGTYHGVLGGAFYLAGGRKARLGGEPLCRSGEPVLQTPTSHRRGFVPQTKRSSTVAEKSGRVNK